MIRHADWIVDVGPAAGRARRRSPLQRPARRARARRGVADAPLSVWHSRCRPRDAARRHRAGCGLPASRATTCATRRRLPLGVFTAVTGVSGSGKSSLVSQALVELVAARSATTLTPEDEEASDWSATPRSATGGRSSAAGGDQAARARRPEADRPHAALEPRHLHRPVRSRAQAVRRDEGRARAPLRRRPLLVQRREGPLRDVRGRRLRDGRAAVPAERLRAVPDVPRRALQREDAGDRTTAGRTSPTCSA